MRKTGVFVAIAVVLGAGSGFAQPDTEEPGSEPVAAPPAANPPPPAAASEKPPGPYYSEPPAGPGAPPPAAPGQPGAPGQYVYEPPPPYAVYEPPPPPKPRHIAPKYALWLGARAGWFIPFGNLWTEGDQNGFRVDDVKWSQFAAAGPMFELDLGARLGRYYTVFLLWERANLGAGSEEIPALGKQEGGDTDYYALGLRFSSNPNKVGFLTEINLGYRRFRATWDSGAELRMTEAPLEFRLGLGADIRLTRFFSLSPLVTLGAGSFGSAEWLNPNGSTSDAFTRGDHAAGHGWVTFQLGAHFDIAGSD